MHHHSYGTCHALQVVAASHNRTAALSLDLHWHAVRSLHAATLLIIKMASGTRCKLQWICT
jgi:hypothetical protein